MRYVKLLSGAEYEIYRCGAAEGVLWIGLSTLSIAQAAAVFSDPAATREIISYYDFGMEQQYFNYMDITYVGLDGQGVLIALREVK